ncbi:hypothetical protein AMTRI_Chr01g126630 [Amborella trichopoda]
MNNRNAQNPSIYFLSLNLSHQKPITLNPISVKTIHLLLPSFNPERDKNPKSHLYKLAEEEELYDPKWEKMYDEKELQKLGFELWPWRHFLSLDVSCNSFLLHHHAWLPA